ncbi:hypothetical protein KIPB_004187 [Kipferlia bialata]|uniref:Uncharacterized protein n=1 Tax=Kipferlia bialata TaxID=797122 RepID=A0A9K3CTG7_9EUKA|nr:hypothetical protein KIPB_004187 [Kipferlia bialata]|eukprot:g4187.t1
MMSDIKQDLHKRPGLDREREREKGKGGRTISAPRQRLTPQGSLRMLPSVELDRERDRHTEGPHARITTRGRSSSVERGGRAAHVRVPSPAPSTHSPIHTPTVLGGGVRGMGHTRGTPVSGKASGMAGTVKSAHTSPFGSFRELPRASHPLHPGHGPVGHGTHGSTHATTHGAAHAMGHGSTHATTHATRSGTGHGGHGAHASVKVAVPSVFGGTAKTQRSSSRGRHRTPRSQSALDMMPSLPETLGAPKGLRPPGASSRVHSRNPSRSVSRNASPRGSASTSPNLSPSVSFAGLTVTGLAGPDSLQSSTALKETVKQVQKDWEAAQERRRQKEMQYLSTTVPEIRLPPPPKALGETSFAYALLCEGPSMAPTLAVDRDEGTCEWVAGRVLSRDPSLGTVTFQRVQAPSASPIELSESSEEEGIMGEEERERLITGAPTGTSGAKDVYTLPRSRVLLVERV